MRSEITNNTTTTVTVTQMMSLRSKVAYAHVACVLVWVEFASELLLDKSYKRTQELPKLPYKKKDDL